jgi:hypothetical protein
MSGVKASCGTNTRSAREIQTSPVGNSVLPDDNPQAMTGV